jgi:hypothetical protein
MEYLEIETLNKSIAGWVEKNFIKALIPFHVNKKDFKFYRVLHIPKVWKEDNYWIVEATIEFSLITQKTTTIIYQIDAKGNIIGYHVPKLSDIW